MAFLSLFSLPLLLWLQKDAELQYAVGINVKSQPGGILNVVFVFVHNVFAFFLLLRLKGCAPESGVTGRSAFSKEILLFLIMLPFSFRACV